MDLIMKLFKEIPECPESISTLEGRDLWMTTCEDQIERHRLTPEVLEAAKCYVFVAELMDTAEKRMAIEGLVKDGEINPWHELWHACSNRMLELDDVLLYSPKARGML
jgi:hypothetical protein